MTLSYAIRLGAMMLPHSDNYLEGTSGPLGPPTSCCALGGAALAAGFERQRDVYIERFLDRHWGAVLALRVPHPVRGDIVAVRTAIHGLNNTRCYHWTRERIAGWIATIEPREREEVPCATTKPATAAEIGRL